MLKYLFDYVYANIPTFNAYYCFGLDYTNHYEIYETLKAYGMFVNPLNIISHQFDILCQIDYVTTSCIITEKVVETLIGTLTDVKYDSIYECVDGIYKVMIDGGCDFYHTFVCEVDKNRISIIESDCDKQQQVKFRSFTKRSFNKFLRQTDYDTTFIKIDRNKNLKNMIKLIADSCEKILCDPSCNFLRSEIDMNKIKKII